MMIATLPPLRSSILTVAPASPPEYVHPTTWLVVASQLDPEAGAVTVTDWRTDGAGGTYTVGLVMVFATGLPVTGLVGVY